MIPTSPYSAGPAAAAATPSVPPPLDSRSVRLARRYEDGYRAARAIVFIGKLIKLIGVVVAIAIVGLAVVAATSTRYLGNAEQGLALIGAALAGVLAWFGMWVWGVLVSAIGQQTLASLDTAVNTSTFLNNDQRAAMMSLS